MQKDELIQLHAMLVQIKEFVEQNKEQTEFGKYYSLHICPSHIHKSKAEHKEAIFTLGKELSGVMVRGDPRAMF